MNLSHLRLVAIGVALGSIALTVIAALIAEESDLAVLGSVALIFGGLFVWAAIGWLRQRPIAPGDSDSYGTNSILKMAIAEVPGLIGFGMAISLGPWWLALVGLGFTMVGLMLAWPSAADQERHELLYLV